MSLTSLDLNPRIIDAAKRARLTAPGEVLQLSPSEIARRAGLSEKDAMELLKACSKQVYPLIPCTTQDALTDLALRQRAGFGSTFLSSGCKNMDHFLNGGVFTGGITEVFGESATCKTLLCLQLAIMAQQPIARGGLQAGCAFICTENAFPIPRLDQVIAHIDPGNAKRLRDNIFIEHVDSVSSLNRLIEVRLPLLLERSRVRLVVIDSIAALFRLDYGLDEASARASNLFSIALTLKRLAGKHGAAIVCTNQVASVDGRTIPALGMAWSTCVNTRLMLARHIQVDGGVETTTRFMHVVFSPFAANGCLPIVVTDGGMKAAELRPA